MKRIFSVSLVFLLIFLTACDNNGKNFTRKSAEKIFEEWNFPYVAIEIWHGKEGKESLALIENQYAVMPPDENEEGFIPAEKLMGYFLGIREYREKAYCIGYCYNAILLGGKVKDITSTGINEVDENNKTVHFSLAIEKTEIGKMFGVPDNIDIVTLFKLYDDGWRFEKILWEESKEKSPFIEKINGFKSEESYANNALWAMHEYKNYSSSYKDLLSKIENSKYFGVLDTVAQVYKDNGDLDKARKIYETVILPGVEREGNVEIINYYKNKAKELRQN